MKTTADITRANLSNYDSDWSVAEYGERRQGLFPMEAALIDEFWPPPPARILDLGCGAGRTTIELHRRGYQTIGIDLSTALIEHARRQHPELDLRLMDATALEFADGSFDAAMFSYNGIDCLYPVSAREKCLREVQRILVPRGIFQISTHNALGAMFSGGYLYPRGYLNAARWLAQQVGNRQLVEGFWRYRDPGGDQYLYSALPDRTVRQAESAGFDVLRIAGATGETDPVRIRRRQQHVHFVLRKR